MRGDRLIKNLNNWVVSAYKAAGFVVLFMILLGLTAYFAIEVFFLTNTRWIAPTIVSPSDERILQLNAALAMNTVALDKLQSDRRVLVGQREDAERTIDAERAFGARFREALRADREARATELADLQKLKAKYGTTGPEVEAGYSSYAALVAPRADALLSARLVDREDYVSAKYQSSQLAAGRLDFEQRALTLDEQIANLRRSVRSLDATLETNGAPGAVDTSTEVVLLQRNATESRLALARAEQQRDSAIEGIAAADRSIGEYERLLHGIRSSPYLRAIEGNLTVAFVPYSNLDSVKPGSTVFGCSLTLIWCHEVGTVARVLEGEVAVKHPTRSQVLRGVMVELKLDEARWAQEAVLHTGRAPLLF